MKTKQTSKPTKTKPSLALARSSMQRRARPLAESMTEEDRTKRNLSPHAEARAAMWIWHDKYGQSAAGSMDFYDRLTDYEKRCCADCVSEIVNTPRKAA